MPAMIESLARSSFLICSQFRITSLVLDAVTSPNTCGWRRTSLSWMPRATSPSPNAPASSARIVWNTIW